MTKVRKKIKASKKTAHSPFKNYWEKSNYLILISGFVILIIGFYLMSQGPWDNPLSLSISPVILLVAYLIVFPISIFYKRKNNKN